MPTPKKLIEVAMPVKEVSAESVRDKSIRHGHISTLHLWWARRPLPVCRAVVFASLVPDPLNPHCPQAFRDAVEMLLGKDANPGDPYTPYADIPWTAIIDPMDDNLRNRLQMFIGKFTDEMQQHLLKHSPKPAAGKQLSDHSLIKWDNKNNEAIIGKARKLIWVAFNTSRDGADSKKPAAELLTDFDRHYKAIKDAEEALYGTPNRHLETKEVKQKTKELSRAIEAFLDKMPRVFDPFAGGGAIPLEAARLGCRSYGNDINPVAHIIQKGSLEFPQRWGKPITYSNHEFIEHYGRAAWDALPEEWRIRKEGDAAAVRIPNRLSYDVAFYARKLLGMAEKEIGHYYPTDKDGKKPIAYYWARVGTCSNPSCKAEVPLLRGFYMADTGKKQVYLQSIIEGTKIEFEVKYGKCKEAGWNQRANLKCPVCGSITSASMLKQQFKASAIKERLIAVIDEREVVSTRLNNGNPVSVKTTEKFYRLPRKDEVEILEKVPTDVERPLDSMEVKNDRNFNSPGWGISKYGQMFNNRQMLAVQNIVSKLSEIKSAIDAGNSEYSKAIVTYLGILIDRIAIANTSFGVWHSGRETLERPMGRQSIPMVFDYPESNPFCSSTGSALNQLDWLTRYIESESGYPFAAVLQNASSGEKEQFEKKHITAVVTDPPYYDAIAYADLSDFFYVWLKRTLADVYPLNFATPQTPKSEECTALRHHHNGQAAAAVSHFERKLLQIFDAIEHQTSDIVSIMFAHQSTSAWTTLCNSILGSRMNITGSWALDTELVTALKGNQAVLSSSVTVACRPTEKEGYGSFKKVREAIHTTVAREVEKLYALGFRGSDLLTACFGQAVSEFGKYDAVEKADGSTVTVAELLEMAREAAFNALLKGFDGDEPTKFYIGWLQLYSFTESDFDDAAKFSRVGLSINVQELFKDKLLIQNGNKQTLGNYKERIVALPNLGESSGSNLICKVHRAMHLYDGKDRPQLLRYIGREASAPEGPFWRVLMSIKELARGTDDGEQATQLLANRDSLISESKMLKLQIGEQAALEFN